jgi:hypothetical protein
MMQFYLRHYREKGAAIALLYPFRHDFYKLMGFGFGTRKYEYSFKPGSLPKGPGTAHIRALKLQDIEAMLACHNAKAARVHGMIQKEREELEAYFALGHVVAGYVEGDGAVKGVAPRTAIFPRAAGRPGRSNRAFDQ